MKHKKIALPKEESKINKLPKEAKQILEILNELDNFTAQLRKKIVADFKQK